MRFALVALAAVLAWAPASRSQPVAPPPISLFFDAASSDAAVSARALERLAPLWNNAYTTLLVDLARFLPRAPSHPEGVDSVAVDAEDQHPLEARPGAFRPASPGARARARLIRFLERQTGQTFGDDLGRWREWMWALPYAPHPDHAAFKREVYGRIDARMRTFFPDGVKAAIRLDEIDWGGVGVNGIPPLVNPRAVPAADATYLKPDHIVFGIVVNGEARAYPRRILAWHELARDRVGGVDLTVVYCTLCGTVIPYESVAGGRAFTFGTSGLLYRSNKLLFDENTGTLWATLTGMPAVGPLVGSGIALTARPVVTTTWAEWKAQHPDTSVLSLDTGYVRDYREGVAYRDYFASDRLMFRVPRTDRRLRNKDEVLGLLVPARGGGRQAAAFDVRLLAKRRVFEADIEGRRFLIVTTPRGANRAYDVGDVRFSRAAGGQTLADDTGRIWAVTDDGLAHAGRVLPRVTAFRAFWFGWYAQFPETLLYK